MIKSQGNTSEYNLTLFTQHRDAETTFVNTHNKLKWLIDAHYGEWTGQWHWKREQNAV